MLHASVHQWVPLVCFVQYWGDAALDAVDNFERKQRHAVGMHTFSRLGAVLVPKYLESALAVLSYDRPTVAHLLAEVRKATKQQWYGWQILCEGNAIHGERRMFNCDQ